VPPPAPQGQIRVMGCSGNAAYTGPVQTKSANITTAANSFFIANDLLRFFVLPYKATAFFNFLS
jgi:hypothetical protein